MGKVIIDTLDAVCNHFKIRLEAAMSKHSPAKYNLYLAIEALNDALSALDRLLVEEISGSEQFETRKVNDAYDKIIQTKAEITNIVTGTLPPAEPII